MDGLRIETELQALTGAVENLRRHIDRLRLVIFAEPAKPPECQMCGKPVKTGAFCSNSCRSTWSIAHRFHPKPMPQPECQHEKISCQPISDNPPRLWFICQSCQKEMTHSPNNNVFWMETEDPLLARLQQIARACGYGPKE
ncbi:hypothetical protein LCGC14_1051410 [marine sediment metagenome]|uniref:Uncharacterized protein n=1 Tax=marine sediment metagenome TaxID=412755 RepID=A0A0F9NAJ3_9ZZZZ